MKVWDAELLAHKGGLQPVTDGLLFWLDGRDELFRYASPTSDRKDYMYERANGYKADFVGALSAHTENGFLVTSSSGTFYLNQSRFPASFDDIKTVEYVPSSPDPFIVNGFQKNNNDIMFMAQWNPLRIPASSFSQYSHIVGTIDNKKVPKFYVNGGLRVAGTIGTGVLSGKPSVTFRWSSSLGCVRLYNRELSPEEIAQNCAYEVSIGRVVL